MKIKMILIKKAISTTTTTSEIFKCYKNSTVFDAQNTGNRISELLDFKFFWGSMHPDPPRGKGPCSPFSAHSRLLLHLQWPLITKVIEIPVDDIVIRYIEVYFTFGLPDYVRYIEEFVISRFVISRFYSIHFTVIWAGT